MVDRTDGSSVNNLEEALLGDEQMDLGRETDQGMGNLSIHQIPASRDRVAARNEYVLKPLLASELGAGEDPKWIWEGYLARGSSTLMTGLWKAGKTTLVSHLLAATSSGGNIGGAVAACKALVISEENATLWAGRRDNLGIKDNVSFVLRPFRGRPNDSQWRNLIDDLAALVAKDGLGLVVVDPLANLLPIRDENDASAMGSALMRLTSIIEAGAALLLLHHPRKGDGGEGQAARGSGALTGWVDIILEMRRGTTETRRVLSAYSRFDTTPSEQVLELTGAGYQSCGTKVDVSKDDRLAAIKELLPTDPHGVDAESLRNAWPSSGCQGIAKPCTRTLRQDLQEGAENGLWKRAGSGHKGDPYRYYLEHSIPARTDSYTAEDESAPISRPPRKAIAEGNNGVPPSPRRNYGDGSAY